MLTSDLWIDPRGIPRYARNNRVGFYATSKAPTSEGGRYKRQDVEVEILGRKKRPSDDNFCFEARLVTVRSVPASEAKTR